MQTSIAPVTVESIAVTQHVCVHSKAIHIQDLKIERAAIVEHMQKFAPDKLEIALVHAIEVGIIEMQARRERSRQ